MLIEGRASFNWRERVNNAVIDWKASNTLSQLTIKTQVLNYIGPPSMDPSSPIKMEAQRLLVVLRSMVCDNTEP